MNIPLTSWKLSCFLELPVQETKRWIPYIHIHKKKFKKKTRDRRGAELTSIFLAFKFFGFTKFGFSISIIPWVPFFFCWQQEKMTKSVKICSWGWKKDSKTILTQLNLTTQYKRSSLEYPHQILPRILLLTLLPLLPLPLQLLSEHISESMDSRYIRSRYFTICTN